jgi:hypothetical protein
VAKKVNGTKFVATAMELGYTRKRDAELAWKRLVSKALGTQFGPSQMPLALAEELKLKQLVSVLEGGQSQFQNMPDNLWLLMRDTIEELS